MDRLGLDAIDVCLTVAKLEKIGIKVYCLAMGGGALTNYAGKRTMGVINVVKWIYDINVVKFSSVLRTNRPVEHRLINSNLAKMVINSKSRNYFFLHTINK